jgi:hypothetical protein
LPNSNSKPHIFARDKSNAAYYQPPSPPSLSKSKLKFKVPIIAPPPFHLIPKRPLSAEDVAEGRLRLLLDKERAMRVGDGRPARWDEERRWVEYIGVGKERVDELDVGSVMEMPMRRRDIISETASGGPIGLNHNLKLGIDDSFRREVIRWMLNVRDY